MTIGHFSSGLQRDHFRGFSSSLGGSHASCGEPFQGECQEQKGEEVYVRFAHSLALNKFGPIAIGVTLGETRQLPT